MNEELSKRASAAEKTVEVLKRKVVDLTNGGRSGLQKQIEASKRREEDNRRRREVAEVRAAELSKYSETLEAEVRRRTETIKTIQDNVTFGFLVVSRDLVVHAEVTKSCAALFGTQNVGGRPLTELLRLSPRAALSFSLACDQIFEDLLPEEVSIGQVQQKFTLPGGRIVRAEPRAIRNESGEVTSLLFTIGDITALEAAQKESAINRTLVSILRQKEAFQAFLLETRAQAKAARVALESGDEAFARRVIHTIKGNAASYALLDIVDLTHDIEEQERVVQADIDRTLDAFRTFLRAHHGVLQVDFDRLGDQAFQISRAQLTQFRTILAELGAGPSERLRHWTTQVLARPAGQLLGPIDDFTARLAERLGKEIDLVVEGGDAVVDVETMRPVLLSLTHLVRNAVDHGIEAPHERGDKPQRGSVFVRIHQENDGWSIHVEDDGRGVDLPKVKQLAVERGVATEDQIRAMSDGGLSLIFIDGLSTASVMTTVSGRGVGMSAVRSAVEAVGGKMTVSTDLGRGTRMKLVVPRPDVIATGGAA